MNQPGKTFGQCRLADTGFTDEKRVVLAPPAKNLHRSLDLELTPDQGINRPLLCLGVEISRKAFECAGFRFGPTPFLMLLISSAFAFFA